MDGGEDDALEIVFVLAFELLYLGQLLVVAAVLVAFQHYRRGFVRGGVGGVVRGGGELLGFGLEEWDLHWSDFTFYQSIVLFSSV